MITVALPVYNSKDIAWLVMESLFRQVTDMPWELLVYEEEHENACGRSFFESYKLPGCVKIKYITSKDKQPLSFKWREMARRARGKMFCICGADNYYQKYMIQDAWDAYRQGHDWLTAKTGYFYNFTSGTLAEFNINSKPKANTGIQMAMDTRLMRKLPPIEKHKLLDNWMFNICHPQNKKTLGNHLNCLGTHGYNQISDKRGKMIDSFQYPFFKTDKTLENIIPADVAEKINKL